MINSLYIHYPFCKHLCHYCDFFKKTSQNASTEQFLDSLRGSLLIHQKFLDREKIRIEALETLYIGGGTPSLLGKDFRELKSILEKYFDLSKLKEFTMEIDPGTCEEDDLLLFQELGVNRMSLGVQSFDPLVQPFLDRSHTVKDICELLESVKKLKINFSVDFMLGLAHPAYLSRNIEKELKQILEYSPHHVSLYILSVSKSYPFFHLQPSDDDVSSEYKKVHKFLSENGFCHYEVSNYAKNNFESQHNWKYWNQESYLALGPSATGLIVNENSGFRYKWLPNSYEIQKEELSLDQLKMEKLYTLLRTKKGVCLDEFPLDRNILTSFCSAGYGEMEPNCFRFNEKGWVILDTLVDKLL